MCEVGSERCSEFGKQCSVLECTESEFGSEHCPDAPGECIVADLKQWGGAFDAASVLIYDKCSPDAFSQI